MKTSKPPQQVQPIQPNFGKRLKVAIQKKRMDQTSVADALGISKALMGQIILGKRSGKSHIPALAPMLEVNPEWLSYGENPPTWWPKDDGGRFWIDREGPEKMELRRTTGTNGIVLALMLKFARNNIPITENGISRETMDRAINYFGGMMEDYEKRIVDKKISCVRKIHNAKTRKDEVIDPRYRA